MKAYKCDRCGKLFEKYKCQGTSAFFNVTRNPNFSSDCLDLCPKCNAELQEWVANDKEQVACNCTDEEIKALPSAENKTDLQSAYDCGYNQACKDKIVSPYKAERGE